MSEPEPTRHWLDEPPTVGAILVTHNGAAWLPKVLGSYARMFHAPDVWRAVDVASTDGSYELARDSFGPARVLQAPRGSGFGAAVALAVEQMPRTDWIWLLHDDAAVLPGTLSGLLDTATLADDIAAVGPKVREWPSLRRLLEVGLTTTGTGGRETGLEPGEPDAGQHDRPAEVLAVGSAGMLVRRSVWDELGGFDPDLPLHFDDVDFGWRAARAGYRVITAPQGVIFHAEASRRRTRRRTTGDLPAWEQRRAALWTHLANAGSVKFWWQYLRLLLGSFVRVAGFLLLKDPESAGDELLAVRSVYAHPLRLLAARRRRRATARRSPRQIRELFPPFYLPYQHGLDAMRTAVAALVRPESVTSSGRRSTVVIDETPEEAQDLDDGPSLLRRRPWFALVIALVVASVVAGRGLIGGAVSGGLSGGALLPSPDTAGGWWMLLVGGSRADGLVDGWPPLFALPLAVAGTIVWPRPDLVVGVLMLFAVPFAALTAHRFGRHLTDHRIARIVWALGYAGLVAGVGAVPQGRLGTVVALVVAPVVANCCWQLAEQPSWRRGLKLGVAISVASAFAPVAVLLSAGALLLLWWCEGRWVARHLVVAAVTPLVLLGPWLIDRALLPTRWWWEAGLPVPGAESLLDVVTGRAGGVSAAWWLSVPVLVLGVAALVPRRTRLGARTAWMFGVFALAVALLGHVTSFAGVTGRVDLSPWVGLPAVLWVASIGTAALVAWPAAETWPRPAVAAVTVAALVLPLGAGAWWIGRGADDPLAGDVAAVVPAFLAERPGRTLVVRGDIDQGVTYRAVRGQGGYLGEEALLPGDDAVTALTEAVQQLLARPTESDIEALGAAGVGSIYLPDADPELARRIDGAPGLEPTGSDSPDARAWVLSDEPVVEQVSVPMWRRAVVGLQSVLWVVAVLLITPVRRREETEREQLDDVTETIDLPAPLPDDSETVSAR